MDLFGVDGIDLRRGEGEWTNLQPVIRKSFASLFDVINRQNSQISELSENVSLLRRELASRPDKEEIKRLIKDSIVCQPETAQRSDLAALHAILINIKADVEKKASIRYVDDSLRRKIDKTDSSIRSVVNSTECLMKLSGDLGMIRKDVDVLQQRERSVPVGDSNYARIDDVKNILYDLKDIQSSLTNKINIEQVTQLVNGKANITEIDGRIELLLKANKNLFQETLMQIDSIQENHEKRITTLELTRNNTVSTASDVRNKSTRNKNILFATDIQENVSSNVRSLGVEESRKEAVLECMKSQLDKLTAISAEESKELNCLKDRIRRLEGESNRYSVRTKDQFESISNHLNELQMRMSEAQASTQNSFDIAANSLTSLHQNIQHTIIIPLEDRFQVVESLSTDTARRMLDLENSIGEINAKYDSVSSNFDTLHGALRTFSDGIALEMKGEIKRIRKEFASAELDKYKSDSDRRITQIEQSIIHSNDISGSVKVLKKVISKIGDDVIDHEAKIKKLSSTIHEETSNDVLQRRIAQIEAIVGKISTLESNIASNNDMMSQIQINTRTTADKLRCVETKLSEFNTLATSLKIAQSTAESSSSIAHAATHAIEELATEMISKRNSSDIDQQNSKLHSVSSPHETLRSNQDSPTRGKSSKKHNNSTEFSNIHLARNTESSKHRLEDLRIEKQKLASELYGNKNSYW